MKARVSGLMGGEPGSRQGSLVQTRAHKHAEQGFWVQTKLLGRGGGPWSRTGLSRGGRGPGCGSGLPQTQQGILQVQSWVLGHNQGVEVSRAEVLGCSQGGQGWDAGPVQEFWERAGWAKP